MSRLEKHIAEYAKAIEDHDWGRRSYFHKELCEHLGVNHGDLRPFEGHSAIMPHWNISRARAAQTIRSAVEELKKRMAD